MIGMSTVELLAELATMRERLRVIREEDEGGWVRHVKIALHNLEMAVSTCRFELSTDDDPGQREQG